jgi:uncharacterized 2Fe-2S/4Fe-4S cluster protein (DUF4445 family)
LAHLLPRISMPVSLSINGQSLTAPPGASLFECAETLGLRVPTSCRKQGKCRECLVEVVEGAELLSPPTVEEQYLKQGFRLSCRCHVVDGSGVVRCHTLRRGRMQIEEHAHIAPARGAGGPPDPAVTRDGEWVLLDGQPLVRAAGPLHGLAVDVGTTTVAVRLVNLETGELVARTAFENPQRFGGSDVLSRIAFDSHHSGRLLQRTLLAYLGNAISEFPVAADTIYEVVVAGNPTMRDLFFGLDVHSIGQKPYRSLTEHEWRAGQRAGTSIGTTARALRLPVRPEARVWGLPLIASHVGADAAANLLAVDLAHEDRLVAIMDLGTNTELIVGNRHRLLAASCPAGPAFEGGGVQCGMPALPGAIERVRILEHGQVETEVIPGAPPEGVCGSGLVDALSELSRTGRMNTSGRLSQGDRAFLLDARHGVSISGRDISELAQAKGANVAGLQIVFKQLGRHFKDVEVFYFSGGFARHINVEAAQRIGLIPQLPPGRVVKAGNLSLAGATLALLSRSRRAELEALVQRIEHVELEADPEFFDHYALGCRFVPVAEVGAVE